MVNLREIRLAGMASITGGLIQIVLGILLSTGMDPNIMPYGQIAYSLSVLLLLGGLLGLLWLKALGKGKWLLVIPLLGFLSQEIAHGIIFYYWDNTVDQPFKPIGAMLVAVGMVACGIATIRAKVWRGWRKSSSLTDRRVFLRRSINRTHLNEGTKLCLNYDVGFILGQFGSGYYFKCKSFGKQIHDLL